MAITPGQGFQVDPNNPNGVIPMAGTQTVAYNNAPNFAPAQAPQAPVTSGTSAVPPVAPPPPSPPATTPTPTTTSGTITTSATTTPTGQTTATGQPLTFNGSVVDLLNSAGEDSSLANRMKLAQTYGMQGYTGANAAQQKEFADKFIAAHAANKGTPAPQSGAAATSALDTYFKENPQTSPTDPTKSFMDAYAGMDPIQASIFQQVSGLLSSTQSQQSLTDFYKQEVAAQGIEELNLELADMNRIMEGTEDDIRDEITKAGGFATESQVQGMTAARNKTLLKKANFLQAQLNAKNDYVDRIVSLTQADREQVSKDLDRKLGITKTLFDMSQQMNNAARENYQTIISQVGYDGLVESINSPSELNAVSKALGLSPKTLLQLSTQQTSAQRQLEMQEMQYQLSVEKFQEDKKQFGMQYALEQQKLANTQAAASVVSPYLLERATRNLETIDQLKNRVGLLTTGPGSLLSSIPGSPAKNFSSDVETLKANIGFSELQAMREASKTGGALGQVAVQELQGLQSSLGNLDIGQSPAQFSKNLQIVEDNIHRWYARSLSIANNFDYKSAKAQGYSDAEIFDFLNK